MGMGAVPWLIMSEVIIKDSGFKCSTKLVKCNKSYFFWQIFPINIKGVGGSLVTLVNWVGAWLVSYTFNFLMGWSSSGTHNFLNQIKEK